MSQTAHQPRRWRPGAIALVIIGIGLGFVAYEKLLARDIPLYPEPEQNFKYGSIGNDGATGVPYAIWIVLPKVFPEYLPGPDGYASLGFRWEPGRTQSDPPLGFSRARVGVERMAINCAFCHVATYRRAAGAPLEFALAGPGNTVDVLAYQNFLTACARDSRFSADGLLPAMEQESRLPWLDRLIYRYAIIPFLKKSLLQQGEQFAWTGQHQRPPWGPGRIDPFNPVKFGMLHLADDGTVGNSDMMAIWNLDARAEIRTDAPLHWDGLNTSVREVVVSSALGDGMTAQEFNKKTQSSLSRVAEFLRRTKPPASPHRPDFAAVNRGHALYTRLCAQCHDSAGARVFTVIPVEEVQTDRHRIDMWTTAARDTYNGYRGGYDWNFSHFQKADGYVAKTLDGLWLLAPYLHNGSVPTLADLLEAPPDRPRAFLRGGEVLDSVRGGFVAPPCDPAHPQMGTFCFDTAMPGNANSGHVYGTDLTTADKADLLAYLLTL
jgi:mono/diheme cytochrome c family protein